MKNQNKKILLLGDSSRKGVSEILKQWKQVLTKKSGLSVETQDLADKKNKEKFVEASKDVDIVIVFGGDGTILNAARSLSENQKPILGVNLGKLGYLAEFSSGDAQTAVKDILQNNLVISNRLMIQTEISSQDLKVEFSSLAVNDVVIQAGPPFRMIELIIDIDSDRLGIIRGDGLIVASSTGSTGHNISAGGPIVEHTLDAIVLTPICPHSLTHRPLVLGAESNISITLSQVNPQTALIIDGQVMYNLTGKEKIEISSANQRFLLIHNRKYSRWHTLQTKLNWGIGPNYTE